MKVCGLAGAALLTMTAAAASPHTATWTISTIRSPQVPNGSLAAESCPAPGTCVAVGSYHGPAGPSLPLAELWDGSAWHVLPIPNPHGGHGAALDAVSCRSASACTATGSYLNGPGTRVTLVEAWNGTTWRVQPSPSPAGSFDSRLTGVSCASASACVAVGYYENQDWQEYPVAFAESWNGQAWTVEQVPNGGAIDSYLYAVSCTGPAACMATGSYSGSGGTAVPWAASWNGTSWTMQVPPAPSNINRGSLTGVSCTSATACIAVGNYVQTQPRTGAQTLAETWNGTAWTIQPTANPGGNDSLAAVSCATATWCTAGGSEGLSSQHALAEVWDGSTWAAQAPAQPAGAADSQLTGVSCTGVGACVAVGYGYYTSPGAWRTLAEAQQGSAWTIQASGDPAGALGGYLSGVSCTTTASCVAVGSVAEAWNGTAWTRLANATPPGGTNLRLTGVSCTAATACMAVGSYLDSSGTSRTLAESWDGTSWRILAPVAPAGAALTGVSCTAARACMAVGSYLDSSGISQTLAESWNGTSWRLLTTVNPGNNYNVLYSVSCTAASACIAVGTYNRPFHYNALTLAEAWNGSTWSQQPIPVPDAGSLSSVSCSAAAACAAVGYNGAHPLAAIWNGTAWSIRRLAIPAGSGEALLNGVSCSAPDNCTAVGYSDQYITASTISMTLAEIWNGTTWVSQPTPIPPYAQFSGLDGISCTTAGACTAVGRYGPRLVDLGVDVPFAEQHP